MAVAQQPVMSTPGLQLPSPVSCLPTSTAARSSFGVPSSPIRLTQPHRSHRSPVRHFAVGSSPPPDRLSSRLTSSPAGGNSAAQACSRASAPARRGCSRGRAATQRSATGCLADALQRHAASAQGLRRVVHQASSCSSSQASGDTRTGR